MIVTTHASRLPAPRLPNRCLSLELGRHSASIDVEENGGRVMNKGG